MKRLSLRPQLGAIFVGFLLLVLSSVAVTFWLVQAQQNDATIINLTGRQRMLAQQMTRLVLTDPDNPELAATVAQFTQTLTALTEGGEVAHGIGKPEASTGRLVTLPPTTNPAIRTRLEEDGVVLTAVAQKQALHILREALTNIRRHAQASQVQITIARKNGAVVFQIRDDGKGFDPGLVNSANHLGLTIMHTRAERSRGQLTVHSTPGEGTQITAVFPAKPGANHSDL